MRFRKHYLVSFLLVVAVLALLGGNVSLLLDMDISAQYKISSQQQYDSNILQIDAVADEPSYNNTNLINVKSNSTINNRLGGSNEHRRPLFIIHVGPPKTGSTTLQCTLESLRDKIEADKFAYIGRPECIGLNIDYERRREFRMFSQALVTDYQCHIALQDVTNNNTNTTEQPFQCWKEFIEKVENYKRHNRNVLFSDEAMSNRIARTYSYRPTVPYPWNALESVLQGWDVRFLTLHRPFYDFLPSVYNEIYKLGPGKRRLKLWHKSNDSEDKCIDQGGKIVPKPFDVDEYVFTIANLMEPGQTLYPTPVQIYQILQNRTSKIMLVDLDYKGKGSEDDFISHIVCEKLPGLQNTCLGLREMRRHDNDSTKQRNPSIPLHYDLIAAEACKRGVVNGSTVSRNFVRDSARQYHEEINGRTANDLALECPDKSTLQKILDISLDHERIFRGKEWREENETQAINKFWAAANEKKKFCTVDSKSVIENKGWKEFLKALVEPQ